MALKEGGVLSYKEGINLQESCDGLHLDHIPSKLAIKEAYVNVTNEISSVNKIDEKTRRKIDNEATVLIRANNLDRKNHTTITRDKSEAKVEGRALALTSVRDLLSYQDIELERKVFSREEINTIIDNVHKKNIEFGLYSQEEVRIAEEFSQELNILNKKKEWQITGKRDTMPQDKKLTKEIIFNALGKHKSSPEFLVILDILGKPTIDEDIDSDRVDCTWNNHGINIVLSYETGIFLNIFLYPNGGKYDEDYLPDDEPCKVICKENDFDEYITMQEVRDKYGKPDRERQSHLGYKLFYYNHNNLKYYFTFTDETQIYSIMIGYWMGD